jgi:hypothetical protein
MSRLNDFYIYIKKFDTNKEVSKILNDNAGIITEMQKTRLEKTGKYTDGRIIKTYKSRLGNVYSNLTILRKLLKGQDTTKVTLKDKGYYYKSIVTRVSKYILTIKANWRKKNGLISRNLDTDQILGFTKKDFAEIKDIVLFRLNKKN